MKGRPRKPTAIIALKGGLEHDKKHYKNRANEPGRIGPVSEDPPDYMTLEQKIAYRKVMKDCHPNVLCNADNLLVEALAVLYAEFVRAPLKFSAPMYGRLFHCLAVLGMTPADRSRVTQTNPDAEKNPFAEFVA